MDDDLAQDGDLDDGEKTQDEEEDEDDPPKAKKGAQDNPHCSINFVMNTPYKFLRPDSDTKVFAEGVLVDSAPRVPHSRRDALQDGDYVLVEGSALTLKRILATFVPENELILQNDWSQFDEDMSGQDLQDLGDETFLLWWQNIVPPRVPVARAPISRKKKKARK